METLVYIGRGLMSSKFEQFGKYLLLEKLATGGMAEVFLARAQAIGGITKFVAIKRILPQFAESQEFIDMFKAEAKIAININHANIVSIHDFGVQKNQFYLVMDYVEGRNLRQITNKLKKVSEHLSIDQVVYVVKEVAHGLDHAHRCLDGATGKPLNITHRDMSPQNVMISFDGQIKIVDFGIAKAESQIETTRAGTLKGKFGYMSPEQAEGQQVDLRTDIFSVGIVLWELLTSDRLFVAGNELNTLKKIRECQVPSLRKINPNIPTELERIAMKALARDRNLRYQTAAAMYRDLNRFLNRQYPEFSSQDFSAYIKAQFSEEIFSIRQRLVEYGQFPQSNLENTRGGSGGISLTGSIPPEGGTARTDSFITSERQPVTQNSLLTKTDAVTMSDPFGKSPDAGTEDKTTVTKQGPPSDFGETPPGSEPPQLDDRAIRREMARSRLQSAQYTLETEDISQPSISARSRSFSRSSMPGGRARSSSPLLPTSYLLAMVGVLCGLSAYVYLAKYKTASVQGLVATLDPYVGPFHSIVGIKLKGDATLLSNAKAPNGRSAQSTPPDPGPIELPPAPVVKTPPGQDPPPLAAEEAKGSLLITSSPSGAEILLNGRPTGTLTPGQIQIPAQREFTITLRRMGYIDYRKEGLMRDSVGSRISATLQEAVVGFLDIDVVPPQNAKIYVNNVLLNGESVPVVGYAVPADAAVTVKAEDPLRHITSEKTVRVARNRRVRVLLDLRGRSNNSRTPSRNH
jgi:serine/threonine protein kinase